LYRSQQLERQLERCGLEADLSVKQIGNLQEELMLRVAELQRHLEVSKEKERTAEQV
jgi:phage FluMu protein gp41